MTISLPGFRYLEHMRTTVNVVEVVTALLVAAMFVRALFRQFRQALPPDNDEQGASNPRWRLWR